MARLEIDPAGARLARYLALAIGVAILVSVAVRFTGAPADRAATVPALLATQDPTPVQVPTATTDLLLPTIALCISADALEARWSEALAEVLHGEREFQIEGGRVDVVTARFAIEVDFLRKWHEGIGQALHYASATRKHPMVALILPEPTSALSASTLRTLTLVEQLARDQRIRLLLLSPANC